MISYISFLFRIQSSQFLHNLRGCQTRILLANLSEIISYKIRVLIGNTRLMRGDGQFPRGLAGTAQQRRGGARFGVTDKKLICTTTELTVSYRDVNRLCVPTYPVNIKQIMS